MSFRNYYESSPYSRNRDTGRNVTSKSIDRPTTVTAKYISTPTYKSSSIPVLNTDRVALRDETPISSIASRYGYSKSDKPTSRYDKTDYKLSVPTISTNKSRDVSPVSTSSKYSISRSSRHISPDRRTSKSFKEKTRECSPMDREKDIPNKTDKSSGYNSLSSYKLYPRTSSYTRPTSKTEAKPEVTVNRYAIANRLSSNHLKSPPTVKRTSVSPVNIVDKLEKDKPVTPIMIADLENKKTDDATAKDSVENTAKIGNQNSETETITVITRHTSPTPPGSSAYVRTRRADMAKTIEKHVNRPKLRPEMIDKEIQSDRLDDPTRASRFGSTSRTSLQNWSLYTPSSNSYTGYAGRYSTQYSNLREPSVGNQYERSSRSRSTEPQTSEKQNINLEINGDENEMFVAENANSNQDIVTVYEQSKDNDTSEIIINVNLKLKKAKSPSVTASSELVSPEITITNSQLPPQAPKTECSVKSKKNKVRKSSTDSSSDSSSKKKVVKKRSKSVSSTDSDQANELVDCKKESGSSSPLKSIHKNSSSSNLQKGNTKLKSTKSRESNSPESSITLSTQSSLSEDDINSKSKTNDASGTSADELSIPTDRSSKQTLPLSLQKSESGTEEAKSFLIRALAPVTNLFKRHQDTDISRMTETSTSESTGKDFSNFVTDSDKSRRKSNTSNIIASNEDNLVKLKAIRHIESGERAWWLDSDSENKNCSQNTENQNCSSERIAKKINRIESGERAWWLDANSDSKNDHNSKENMVCSKQHHKPTFDEDETPWWLDNGANVPEGIERLTPPRKTSSASEKSEKHNFFKVRRIESGDQKDWWLSSNDNSSSCNKSDGQNSVGKSNSDHRTFPLKRIRHIDSGERPWWLSSDKNIPEGIEKLPTPPPQDDSESSEEDEIQVYVPSLHVPPFPLHLPDDEPLGDRRSPEGLETPRDHDDYRGRISPYENSRHYRNSPNYAYQRNAEKYISRCTDIDDILGSSGKIYSPFINTLLKTQGQMPFNNDDDCEEIDPTQVRIHDSTAQRPVIKKLRGRNEVIDYHDQDQLDDATLQVFKDGDYGPYLDLESTLCEQDEELEGLQDNRKNAIVLRTQLSVRVDAIIEKLLHSQGRDLRQALFTLKRILQSDKDLVHEFVAHKGLDCLMQVGSMVDPNMLEYILRALGQVLLYVDGMHGVMAHKKCIQWLYSLISCMHRHVVKTALKLLVIFVEYTENNSLLLIDAIRAIDTSNGRPPWFNIIKILKDFDASDTELLIYATTVINKCLNNASDRNIYYDQVDALQDQGMDDIIKFYMSKQGTDLDLLRQFQIFDAVLVYEDGDGRGTAIKQLDESVINSIYRRNLNLRISEKRISKRQIMREKAKSDSATESEHVTNNNRKQFIQLNTENKENKDLSSALRRRRDRHARQANHITQQELFNNCNGSYNSTDPKNNGDCAVTNGNHNTNLNSNSFPYNLRNGSYTNTNSNFNGSNRYSTVNGHQVEEDAHINRVKTLKLAEALKNENQRYTAGLKQRIQNGTLGHSVSAVDTFAAMRQKQIDSTPETKDDRGMLLNREHSIKDLAQKLTTPVSPTSEDKPLRVSDMAGIVLKAKEELAKSQSKEIIKSPTIEKPKVPEIKISENDLYWEELKKGCLNKEFHLCDLDFSDLRNDSDDDLISPAVNAAGIPPPPPPAMLPLVTPPPFPGIFSNNLQNNSFSQQSKALLSYKLSNDSDTSTIKKNKKTVKLFWREIQDNPVPSVIKSKIGGFIWDDLPEINIDTKMLEHLFESRTNDLIIKKLMEPKRNLILDAKRSNAINIAMKKLPTPQTIKAAIMKMDATVIGREGIEKLLTMLPTDEEKVKIQEAQYANPDLPLGSAEQFLLTLASINELSSRLKLWVFKLDFDNLEKEIAEPLMDLKQGIELLKANRTFKIILSTLRSVGSFLNGSQVKGFRLEYLSKVMEVKDTVHKHPLLHHICEMIIEKNPDTTDLFSEVGPVIRASKVDFEVLEINLSKLESDCKASWDHMKKVAKHDSSQIFKTKINEFLTDAAQRIILLTFIKNRVMNRYSKFLLYLGVPLGDISKTKPSEFLKVIAEFALEYRTSRERVLHQLEKKANHRERNKTRGKMIIDVGNYSSKNGDHTADTALKELLKTDPDTDSLTDGRRKSQVAPTKRLLVNGDLSADDEIIESLVRSATTRRRPAPRERRRDRLSDKKSLNRTLEINKP